MHTCPFCKLAISLDRTTRIAGFDICDQCYHGDLPNRMKIHRDWKPTINEWTVETDDFVIFYTEIFLALPNRVPFDFKAKRKRWWHFLSKGVTVGDPLFDNFAHVKSKSSGRVQRWLEDESAQSIVMDLLGDVLILKSERGVLYLRHRSEDYTNPQTLFVEMAALGHTVEAFQEAAL